MQSTIISATSPLLTGLVAYRIAHLWAMDERNASNKKAQEGPTPLQSVFPRYQASRPLEANMADVTLDMAFYSKY